MTEASLTALGGGELVSDVEICADHGCDHHLRDTLAGGDRVRLCGEVCEGDLHFSSVVGVDDANAVCESDAVLGGKAASGKEEDREAAVLASVRVEGKACGDEGEASGEDGDGLVDRGTNVRGCGTVGFVFGDPCTRVEELDFDFHNVPRGDGESNSPDYVVAILKLLKCFLRYRAGHKGFHATPYVSGTRGKEGLVNALGHLTSHSLPLGSPSLARFCDAKSHFLYRASGEFNAYVFKERKLFV